MFLPNELLKSLEGTKGFDRQAFQQAHEELVRVTSVRINPLKVAGAPDELLDSLGPHDRVPWCRYGYYLHQRPSFTLDPLFHAGCYYVQEASSMFLEQALMQTVDLSRPLKILDLAAAPGGKSTHILSLVSAGSLLVSNEVIRGRMQILKDNLVKWGSNNVVLTNNDPRDFAKLENYFDVIVVDAPCSGSGLFRRDEDAINEWSMEQVEMCSRRQKRILADAWPALKKNGIVIYSTCSYSTEENENISAWISSTFAAENLTLKLDPAWHITPAGTGCRFWPDKLKGEGFFIACLRKRGGDDHVAKKNKRPWEDLNKKEIGILQALISTEGDDFLKHRGYINAVPLHSANEIRFLLESVRVSYFGTMIGEIVRDKLIPSHSLAMSGTIQTRAERLELDQDAALAYLKRNELKHITASQGWKLVVYRGHPLGWINVLQNRINNYYPKELRILKDI